MDIKIFSLAVISMHVDKKGVLPSFCSWHSILSLVIGEFIELSTIFPFTLTIFS